MSFLALLISKQLSQGSSQNQFFSNKYSLDIWYLFGSVPITILFNHIIKMSLRELSKVLYSLLQLSLS